MPSDERANYDGLLFAGERVRFCRECGALIVVELPRGGRPRAYCDRCRATGGGSRQRRRRPAGCERECRGCGARFV